jgi:hypothetical protein
LVLEVTASNLCEDIRHRSGTRLSRPAVYGSILVAIGFAAVFFIARLGTLPVFDDTASLVHWGTAGEPVLAPGPPASPYSILCAAFRGLSGAGYRPLSTAIANLGVTYVGSGAFPFWLWVAGVAALFGATATIVFIVAWYFLRRAVPALMSTALFMFCAPLLGASWVVWAGIQVLVPLAIASGLWVYLRGVENPEGRFAEPALLAAILFLAPWVREFSGTLALIILFAEAVRARRPTRWMLLAAVGLLHAFFPTLVPRLLFAADLPLLPVTRLGLLGTRMGVEFQPFVAHHVVFLIPPTFFLFCALALFISPIRWKAPAAAERWHFAARIALFGNIVGFAVASKVFHNHLLKDLAWVFVSLIPAVFAMRVHPVLSFWYLFSYLPFLKLFTQETHLLYLVAPLSIIAMCAVIEVSEALSTAHVPVGRICGAASWGLAVLLVADQSLNLMATTRVMHKMSETTGRIARWLEDNVPPNAVLVVNALQGFDLALMSRNHVDVRWSYPHPSGRTVSSPESMETLMEKSGAAPGVYLLSVDYDFLPEARAFHSHRWALSGAIAIERVGRLVTLDVRYPFLDPLKHLARRPYVSFLGPPDEVNDVYHGPARDGQWFVREHFAHYDLYRVVGRHVDRDLLTKHLARDLELLQEGLWAKGTAYNIFSLDGRVFAVPQAIGAVDAGGLRGKLRQGILAARSFPELVATLGGASAVGARAEGVKELAPLLGFRRFQYGDRFYATSREKPQLSAEALTDCDFSQCVSAATLERLDTMIAPLARPVDQWHFPWLAQDGDPPGKAVSFQ